MDYDFIEMIEKSSFICIGDPLTWVRRTIIGCTEAYVWNTSIALLRSVCTMATAADCIDETIDEVSLQRTDVFFYVIDVASNSESHYSVWACSKNESL